MDRLRLLLRGVFYLNFFFGVFTFGELKPCFLRFLSFFGSVSELLKPDGDLRVEIPIRYLCKWFDSGWLRCCVLIIYVVCDVLTLPTDGYVSECLGFEVQCSKDDQRNGVALALRRRLI